MKMNEIQQLQEEYKELETAMVRVVRNEDMVHDFLWYQFMKYISTVEARWDCFGYCQNILLGQRMDSPEKYADTETESYFRLQEQLHFADRIKELGKTYKNVILEEREFSLRTLYGFLEMYMEFIPKMMKLIDNWCEKVQSDLWNDYRERNRLFVAEKKVIEDMQLSILAVIDLWVLQKQ